MSLILVNFLILTITEESVRVWLRGDVAILVLVNVVVVLRVSVLHLLFSLLHLMILASLHQTCC